MFTFRNSISSITSQRIISQRIPSDSVIDNVVYRLGFANSRNAARQLVSHGHVTVNKRKVNVASYNLKAGDTITIKEKPGSRRLVTRNLDHVAGRSVDTLDPFKAAPKVNRGARR